MNVGILGTGNLAVALGRVWAAAGHEVLVTGRDAARARAAAGNIGGEAVEPGELSRADVVVVAIAWEGLEDAVSLLGRLAGRTLIDCTNAVDYATGALKPSTGSAAEFIARLAPEAHVVKALHLFAGASWPYTGAPETAPVVAICGDDDGALKATTALVEALGAKAAIVGGLEGARQLEEAAGFVMRVVGAGHNPRFAVPDVEVSRPQR